MAVSQLLDKEDKLHSSDCHEDRTRPQTPPIGKTYYSLDTPTDDLLDHQPEVSKTSFHKALQKKQDCMIILVSNNPQLPSEWWNFLIANIWAILNLLLAIVVITIFHKRVPDKSVSPPLQDLFFDYLPHVEWAFCITEVNGMILVALWFIQWLFLKHRAIVGQRFFFLQGVLHFYRMVMFFTPHPIPGMNMECAPKLYGISHEMFCRVVQLVSGGGLSNTDSFICEDFLNSGHTVMLTLTYLFIHEYSPRSKRWRYYHVICWLLSFVGMVCILIARKRYSVNVVVAYFITTRLFYWYHTMANNQDLRGSPYNRPWWSPMFNYLEKNVRGPVPCTFSWPVLRSPVCLVMLVHVCVYL